MACAQLLRVTNTINNRVEEMERSCFPSRIHAGHAGSIILTGNQLRQDPRRWLSPPDPSTNHQTACRAHHKGTAAWFFEGRTYNEWKSTGSESLLWIHGKRVPLTHSSAWHHLITPLLFVAGSGKSILWLVEPSLFLSTIIDSLVFAPVRRSSKI
jgi:hypothetical protein